MQKLAIYTMFGLVLVAGGASAKDYSGALSSFTKLNVVPWLDEPIILDAVRAQNKVTADYDQAIIDQLDGEWRDAEAAGDDRIAKPVVTSEVANYLRDKFVSSGGAITEIIIMDAKGLNVAATEAPSDYWQGDEDKFSKSFGAGPDGIDFGDAELDESSGRYQALVSLPISDPKTGELIGAVTVGVDLLSLD
jgi:hypothetical protein